MRYVMAAMQSAEPAEPARRDINHVLMFFSGEESNHTTGKSLCAPLHNSEDQVSSRRDSSTNQTE